MELNKELLDLECLHCKSCAKGRILELDEAIEYSRNKIKEIKAVFDDNAKLALFNGFSFKTAQETAKTMGDYAWDIEQYRNAISEIKEKFSI